MSNFQHAFISKKNIPKRAELQDAIDSLDFSYRLKILHDYEVLDHFGFLPCELEDLDDEVGFEKEYLSSDEGNIHATNIDDSKKRDLDYCISMCWRGSMKDYSAVMIVSAALSCKFDAIICFDGQIIEQDELVQNSELVLREAECE